MEIPTGVDAAGLALRLYGGDVDGGRVKSSWQSKLIGLIVGECFQSCDEGFTNFEWTRSPFAGVGL